MALASAPHMKYATAIATDSMSRCMHISDAIPSNLLNKVFSQLKDLQWFSHKKYFTLWFVEKPCECSYEYTGFCMPPSPMPQCILDLKQVVQDITGAEDINSCNANLYKDESHSLTWHSDNEDLFLADRQKATIVSVSLGAERTFCIRSRADGLEIPIKLSHGDICTMEGFFQKFYEHCLLPQYDPADMRINLTFRSIVLHTKTCPCRDE